MAIARQVLLAKKSLSVRVPWLWEESVQCPPWALLEWVSMNVSLGASPGRLPLVTEGYVSACALALTLILVLRMRSSSLVLS